MNAKELQLYLLNASTKTLGLYTYGISIGMDFRDITRILTSPIGLQFSKLLNGNVFQNDNGTYSVLNTFNYYELSPRMLDQYSAPILDELSQKYVNIYDDLLNLLKEDIKSIDSLIEFATSNKTLDGKLGRLEQIRKTLNTRYIGNSQKIRYKANQLIDFAEEYVRQQEVRKVYSDEYEALKILAKGADEMRTLGSLYSLNQGLPTSPQDLLAKVLQFQDLINDRIDIQKAEARRKGEKFEKNPVNIDLVKFVYNEEYRDKIIRDYEAYKQTFNVPEALTVSHFFGYLQQLANAHISAMKTNWRYRSAYKLYTKYKHLTSDKKKLYSGILDYLNDFTINSFLDDSKASIIIPAGFKYYVGSEERIELQPTDVPKVINLGTINGNATFKRWMDSEVLPNLKRGIISANGTVSSIVKGNRFIQELEPHLFTKTTTGVQTISYSLSSNMLPRSDAERSMFNVLKSAFNQLHNISYTMADGTTIPLIDLLYYYNLVTFSNKLGQQTLTSIFSDFQNMGVIQKYHEYQAMVDKYKHELTSTSESNLYPYVASFNSPYSATDKVIFYRDTKRSFTPQLLRKLTKKEFEDAMQHYEDQGLDDKEIANIRAGIINSYAPIGNLAPSKYHLKGKINYNSSNQTSIEVDGDLVVVSYGELYIQNIKYKDKTLNFPKGTRMPLVQGHIDETNLKALIRNLINQC